MAEADIFLKDALHFGAEGCVNGSLLLLRDRAIARLVVTDVGVCSGIHAEHHPCASSLETVMKQQSAVSGRVAPTMACLW